MAVGGNGFVQLARCRQQTTELPLPAEERLRGVGRLGGEDRLSGQLQRLVVTMFGFIQVTEIAIGIGARPRVADVLRHGRRFQQHAGRAQQQGCVHSRHRGTELLVAQPHLNEIHGLVVRRLEILQSIEGEVQPVTRVVRLIQLQRHAGCVDVGPHSQRAITGCVRLLRAGGEGGQRIRVMLLRDVGDAEIVVDGRDEATILIGLCHGQRLGQILHRRVWFARRQVRSTETLHHGGDPGAISRLLYQSQRQFQLLQCLTDLPQRFRGLRGLCQSPTLFSDLAASLVEVCRLLPRGERLSKRTPLVRLKTLRHQGVRSRLERGDRSRCLGQHEPGRENEEQDEPDQL